MHPPRFRLQDKLSDWPDCLLHLYCCRYVIPSVRMLLDRAGDQTFQQLIEKLRCQHCHQAPAPVYLCAGHHREACGGGLPDWSIELVPEPETPLPFLRGKIAKQAKNLASLPERTGEPVG